METISNLTRLTRSQQDLTGEEFAAALSIRPLTFSRAAISLWESGQNKPRKHSMQWIYDNTPDGDWRHDFAVKAINLLGEG